MFRTSFLFPLYAPIETPADSGGSAGLDKEETIKFFEDDETDETETIELDRGTKETDKKGGKEKESEEPEDKEDDEEDTKDDDEEIEDEEEEDEIEKLLKEAEEDDKEIDEEEIPEPPRRKEILAKYPKLFKEFPALEKAYYREQQFTELFPTMKDAKEAAAKATALEGFEQELRSGKIEPILSVIQKHNENAFNTMVDDLIPTLLKVNEKAGYHVISNIIKDTIVTMVKTGKKNDNKELLSAAKELNKFMFASEDFEPPTRLGKETQEEETKEDPVKKREQELIRREFEKTRDNLNTRVDKILRKTIEGNIDPRGSMTDYVRKNATREALEQTTDLISKDKRFRQVLDKLWEKAIKSDFKEEDVNRINAAYISKAKTVLPSVIKKARQEALKGMGKRVKEEAETEETREPEDTTPRKKKRDAAPSNTRGQDSEKERARKIPANVSTKDYLMAD